MQTTAKLHPGKDLGLKIEGQTIPWDMSNGGYGLAGSGGSRISLGGGANLVGGGTNSQCAYVSKILYVKTKELDP